SPVGSDIWIEKELHQNLIRALDAIDASLNSPCKYLKYAVIPIIAALSVVYSNLGIKVFHPYSVSASFNRFRIPEFADTPPPIAICVIPVCSDAFTNFSI